jgi:hypothetical protein
VQQAQGKGSSGTGSKGAALLLLLLLHLLGQLVSRSFELRGLQMAGVPAERFPDMLQLPVVHFLPQAHAVHVLQTHSIGAALALQHGHMKQLRSPVCAGAVSPMQFPSSISQVAVHSPQLGILHVCFTTVSLKLSNQHS